MEANVKNEILRYEKVSVDIIRIVANEFRHKSRLEYPLYRRMHVASILFETNVLNKMESMTDLDKYMFYDAFITLFSKTEGDFTESALSSTAPAFRNVRISGHFAHRLSNYEDILREWDAVKKRAAITWSSQPLYKRESPTHP